MKWLLLTLLLLIALVGIVALIGMMVPLGHTASRRTTLAQSPEAVWAAITDYAAFPSWRADVQRVEAASSAEGRTAWVEHSKTGRLPIEVVASDPPRRLVTRIADRTLPFGGTWTYELRPVDNGTLVTITEDGEVYNVLFRFMARFVFGYTTTMESYLRSLEKKFSEGK